MAQPATWSIELDVREDAERMFVPIDELEGAAVGDLVEVTSTRPPGLRRGRIVDEIDDERRGRFVAVVFE